MVKIIKISGQSLKPLFDDGDFVLVTKIPFFFFNRIRTGDIVVFNNSTHGMMIKKVDNYDRNKGELWVTGTHRESVDSREIGPVDEDDLVGKVVIHFRSPR
jgi:signal peptidase I